MCLCCKKPTAFSERSCAAARSVAQRVPCPQALRQVSLDIYECALAQVGEITPDLAHIEELVDAATVSDSTVAKRPRKRPASLTPIPSTQIDLSPSPLDADSDVLPDFDLAPGQASDDAKTAAFTVWPATEVRDFLDDARTYKDGLANELGSVPTKSFVELLKRVPPEVMVHFDRLQNLMVDLRSEEGTVWNSQAKLLCDALLTVASEVDTWWATQSSAARS